MRTLSIVATCLWFVVPVLAKPTQGEIDKQWAAERVQDALRQSEPIPWKKDGLVVPTAEVAIAIHTAVVRAAFGEQGVRDKPFVAVRSGDYWVVRGTLPKGFVGGTPITVIRAKDGAVLWMIAEACWLRGLEASRQMVMARHRR